MKLYFKSSRGERREVAEINEQLTSKEQFRVANEEIAKYVKKLNPNYKIPYTRVYNIAKAEFGDIHNGNLVTWFDVGSHSEFFFVHPAIFFEEKYQPIRL